MIKYTEYDVIVIGSGGAGLRAAIGAAQTGATTLMLTRGRANRSGATLLAGANISADLSCDGATLHKLGLRDRGATDTPEAWMEDILHEGFYLNNQSMVLQYVETAGERLKELLDMGVKILGVEGDREVSLQGSDILDKLYAKAISLGVTVMENMVFSDLVARDGCICGAVCLEVMEGTLMFFPAKAVIVATGGSHNIFSFNSGSTDLCGEGQASALRAGAELVDMEIISFCPTVITHPQIYKGNILPYIFFSIGFGEITNKYGKPFISRYLSAKAERLATDTEWNKMLLSYAMQREIGEGRANLDNGLYFFLNGAPDIMDELYAELPSLRTGIYSDIMKIFQSGSAVTVCPSAHYFEGGIRVDQNMSTGIRGLFAAGECAGGMFGANRVCAATTEMLVGGAVAGASAGEYVKSASIIPPQDIALRELEAELLLPLRTAGGESANRIAEATKSLRNTVNNSLSVIRDEETLSLALDNISNAAKLLPNSIAFSNKERAYNMEWIQYLQYRNMLLTARATLKSALLRKESRGVHYRSDHPYTDNDHYLKNIIVENACLSTRMQDVAFTFSKPREGIADYMDYIETVVERLEANER